MILTYSPDGGEPQKWHVQFKKLRTADAELLEKLSGVASFVEFQNGVTQGHSRSRRALVYLMLRRTHPALKFDDFDPLLGDIDLDFDRDEMRAIRDKAVQDPSITATQREALDAMVEAAEEAPPKAASSSAA